MGARQAFASHEVGSGARFRPALVVCDDTLVLHYDRRFAEVGWGTCSSGHWFAGLLNPARELSECGRSRPHRAKHRHLREACLCRWSRSYERGSFDCLRRVDQSTDSANFSQESRPQRHPLPLRRDDVQHLRLLRPGCRRRPRAGQSVVENSCGSDRLHLVRGVCHRSLGCSFKLAIVDVLDHLSASTSKLPCRTLYLCCLQRDALRDLALRVSRTLLGLPLLWPHDLLGAADTRHGLCLQAHRRRARSTLQMHSWRGRPARSLRFADESGSRPRLRRFAGLGQLAGVGGPLGFILLLFFLLVTLSLPPAPPALHLSDDRRRHRQDSSRKIDLAAPPCRYPCKSAS
mmetsp:Transcript_32573/g.69841  ORF Transcript_32573/g.69841 Transcript_32573/m.69841 type:complete len:346 (+) Transcript_32573:2509-3546(+)